MNKGRRRWENIQTEAKVCFAKNNKRATPRKEIKKSKLVLKKKNFAGGSDPTTTRIRVPCLRICATAQENLLTLATKKHQIQIGTIWQITTEDIHMHVALHVKKLRA